MPERVKVSVVAPNVAASLPGSRTSAAWYMPGQKHKRDLRMANALKFEVCSTFNQSMEQGVGLCAVLKYRQDWAEAGSTGKPHTALLLYSCT